MTFLVGNVMFNSSVTVYHSPGALYTHHTLRCVLVCKDQVLEIRMLLYSDYLHAMPGAETTKLSVNHKVNVF